MKRLQIALDVLTVGRAREILEQTADHVDIIELGTPLLAAEGATAVREIKAAYPDKIVFADYKIMDGGKIMSDIAFDAGADMVSVLAAAHDATIKDVIENARAVGRMVLVDMCGVKDLEGRSAQVDAWGPDYLCVHVAYDIQQTGVDPVEEVTRLGDTRAQKAAAGGIRLETFEHACQADIDDIIVGGGIYGSDRPGEVARAMREALDSYA